MLSCLSEFQYLCALKKTDLPAPDPTGAMERRTPNLVKNRPLRIVLLVCGFLFTLLAFLGALLPLLPTTPFLIVAAACFFRSSARFYNWIMFNRLFGHYLQDYQSGRGVAMHVKIMTLSFMWISTLVSIFVFVPWLWLKIVLPVISTAVTIHVLMIHTKRPD
jgi:uncharacterized membrane protein YbaN (DUF454 family)